MRLTTINISDEYDNILKKYDISISEASREGIILMASLNPNFPQTEEEEELLIKSKIAEIKRKIIRTVTETNEV